MTGFIAYLTSFMIALGGSRSDRGAVAVSQLSFGSYELKPGDGNPQVVGFTLAALSALDLLTYETNHTTSFHYCYCFSHITKELVEPAHISFEAKLWLNFEQK